MADETIIYPLQPNWVKVISCWISAFLSALIILLLLVPDSRTILNFSYHHQLNFLFVMLFLFLGSVAFSKEKIETREIMNIRYSAFRISFGATLIAIFALSFMHVYDPHKEMIPVLIIGYFLVLAYLIPFHIDLWLQRKKLI